MRAHRHSLLRFFCILFSRLFNDTMDFDCKGWVDWWMFRRKTMLEVPMRARTYNICIPYVH